VHRRGLLTRSNGETVDRVDAHVPWLVAAVVRRRRRQPADHSVSFLDGEQSPSAKAERMDFCLDPEGWTPVSSVRYAFTPCFQDGVLAAVAPLLLLLVGSVRGVRLSHSARVPGARSWAYHLKIATVLVLLGLSIALAAVRWRQSAFWQRDVFVWSALLKVLATLFAFSLHHLEHVRNSWPVPSGVLLFYWLGTILIDGIKEYSLIDKGIEDDALYFSLFSISLCGEVLIFLLEYLAPKGTKNYHLLTQEEDDGSELCPADYADIFSR
jgi:ATP-binding cassette, subfamily C (CFTR/MRP), member 1